MEGDRDGTALDHLAELDRGGALGVVGAVANGHDVERAGGRGYVFHAGAGVVGVAVRDESLRDRRDRIDVEVPRRAVEPLRGGMEEIVGAQAHGRSPRCALPQRKRPDAGCAGRSRFA